ncbi:Hypothetical predicted protein [Mytilus galloprovincialis]|uniref:Novel STAND NTPase 3 domain-containing protein n=1 Tax=Mytilus galloprovincialis TaxID=29158 RepID=A0A8B6DII3_MYTGA|nr:Hypothetical predicted protein [Mytilus galloprovincialis]
MGKSMLLQQTALFLKIKKGYSIFSCHGPLELVRQYRAYTKQVFILDDACGQFTLVQSNVDQWKQYETRIARIIESATVIIISSCRSNVFMDKQCQSLLIFSGCRCDLNDGEYAIDKQEKITIAKNYLSQQTMSEVESDLDSFDMFPLLCRLYTERVTWSSIKFFYDPFNFYKEEMDGFYKEDGWIRCCSLFLCVINSGLLNQTILMDESESVFWQKFKTIFAEFGLKPDLSRKSVIDSLDTLVNSYIKKRDDEFHILHDRLFDFLCYYFGQRHQRLMINYADSRMIRDRTLLKSLGKIPQEFTILIDRQNETEYIHRLVKDMLSGYLDDVLYNHQIRYEDFRLKLLAHLQKLDDSDLTVTNIFSDFVIDENEKPSSLIPVDFACKYGYTELFEFFLSKTKNINAYEGSNIPLITACRKGDKFMTGLLLEKGADVNQTDVLGGSPLTWSCVYGNLSIVKMLLNKGADITYIDVCSECCPLVWPCLGELLCLHEQTYITQNEIDELFFTIEHIIHTFLTVLQNGYSRGCIVANETCAHGKPPGLVNAVQTILEIIYRGNIEVYPHVRIQPNTTNQISPFIEIMNLFLDRGVDIDKYSIGGLTALSFACMIDIENSQSVSYLLSKGASVNKYEKEGTFPVHIAIRLGNEGLVKLLIDNGANINLPVDGISPIDWAISKHNIPIIDSLIEAGANINHRYKNGFTLLHFAIKRRDEKLIKSLLKGGISVHYEDRSGDTPLIIAVNLSLVNVVAILIKEGAEVDTYNSKGVSPLMLASSKGDVNIVKIMLQEKLLFTKIHSVDCLFSACRNQHLEVVILLLEKGYDINITEPNNGNTCLLEASRDGYTSMVALLLDKAANVNASNRNWDTPLIMASKNGHTHIVRLLVAKGAYMYRSNKKGESSTTVACINNHLEVIKVLTDNGCNIDCIEKKSKQTSLSVASYHGYDKIVAYLIRHGANVNTQNYIGNTPLKLAATKCHFNIVKMLVEHKANINIRNNEGSASVSAACYHDNDEIVAYLIEHGANIDTQNNKGNTPLMLAASKGYFNIVKMLVENKANVNIGNEEGFTCVSVASYHGNCEILAYLIVHGASVNTQNKKGNTALMIAASKGRLYIVEILIEHGADVNIRNDNGSTSVELASYKYNDKMLAYLIEHGARVNTQNNEGNTPLMIAATKDCLKIIKILIKHGADINIRNEEGSTCLSFASEKGLDNIVEYLLDKKASINSANNNGDTPLMLALQNDNVSTAKLLLDFGANVNIKNKEGLPPLHFARINKHYEIEVILNKTLQKEFNRNARQLIFITFVIFITWLYFTRFNVMLYSEL